MIEEYIRQFPRSIADLIALPCAFAPDKEALVNGDHRITFNQLDRLINGLVSVFSSTGVGLKARVGILLPSTIQYVTSILAIARSGAIFVPIPLTESKRSISEVFSRYRLGALISSDPPPTNSERFQASPLRTLIIITPKTEKTVIKDFWEIGQENPKIAQSKIPLLQAAAILKTSGSGGDRKAVVMSHAGMIANILSNIESLGLKEDDRTLVLLPLHYSYALIAQVLSHLLVGATVVFPRAPSLWHMFDMWIEQERITTFMSVPTMVQGLLRSPAQGLHDISSLRLITVGGAYIDPEYRGLLEKRFPNARVVITYGLAEAGPRVATLYPEDAKSRERSVGRANPGVEIKILDRRGRALPAGKTGEIAVLSPSIMLGYDKPRQTPRLTRYLMTGDIGYLDEDGYLFIRGRRKTTINKGGERVPARKIESALKSYPGVENAVVLAQKDYAYGEVPVAWVTPTAPNTFDKTEFLTYLKSHLGDHEIPRVEILER